MEDTNVETNVQQTDSPETNGPEDANLAKALDDNLAAMNDLLKAKGGKVSKADLKEMMKDKNYRQTVKECMAEYMKDEEAGDDDDKDDKIKKSLDDATSEHDEVIDAVPVLKSFLDVLSSLSSKIEGIESNFNELKKSFDDQNEIQKSFGGVINSQSELIKSMTTDLATISNQPVKRKGVITKDDLVKSELDDDKGPLVKSASLPVIKDILLKSFQANEISGSSISKWEQSGYNMAVFTKQELSVIESKIGK